MDGIIGFIVVAAGFYFAAQVIGWVFGLLGAGARAVKNVVTGEETYFGPPQIKCIDEVIEGTDVIAKRIMFRGRLAVPRAMAVSCKISAFDATDDDDNLQHLISMFDSAQEAETVCFGQSVELGNINEGDSVTDWIQLGALMPDFIQPPKSGDRTIRVLVRMVSTSNPPKIMGGFSDGEGEVLDVLDLDFDHYFADKGYEEAAQDREEAQTLSLKIGIAVAMADGTLDDSEGEILKNWVEKEVSAFSGDAENRLKQLYNDTLKEGFFLAQAGNLALTPVVERLAEIGEKKTKYDAIELCFDVMAADGVADPEEMAVIRNVAESLDLNMDEIEKMREGVTLNLSTVLTSEEGLESLVGLEKNWSSEEKKKHLRVEFQKWSNRLSSLPEGEEREAAQNMLDNIAALRKKYA